MSEKEDDINNEMLRRNSDRRFSGTNVIAGSGVGGIGLLFWLISELSSGGNIAIGCGDCEQDLKLVRAEVKALNVRVLKAENDLLSRKGHRFNMPDWIHQESILHKRHEAIDKRIERLENKLLWRITK